MNPFFQRRLHCPCGHAQDLAHRPCVVCYALRRQDRVFFGGLREQVLSPLITRCPSLTRL